jgi:hypothetical protein
MTTFRRVTARDSVTLTDSTGHEATWKGPVRFEASELWRTGPVGAVKALTT